MRSLRLGLGCADREVAKMDATCDAGRESNWETRARPRPREVPVMR